MQDSGEVFKIEFCQGVSESVRLRQTTLSMRQHKEKGRCMGVGSKRRGARFEIRRLSSYVRICETLSDGRLERERGRRPEAQW